MVEKELIKFFKSLGLDVHTSTKARGHLGLYLKKRIDISKNTPKERVVPTLLHEFAHYIHSVIEPSMEKTGGTLQAIFNQEDISVIKNELLAVTNFVDKNSKFEKLEQHKQILKNKIREYENEIKKGYPDFMRSKKFKEFNRYIKKSNARYLLKYDRVKLVSGVMFKKVEMLSIDNIERDFPDMPKEFASYIRLVSCRKKKARVSSKINRLNKYYNKPTELFARLVEGLYIDSMEVRMTAPVACRRFFQLLDEGYYKDLSVIFKNFYE